MRFVAEQPVLARALQLTNRIVSPQNTLPALAGILVNAETDHVTLSATDLTSQIQTQVPAVVEEPGATVLPGATFTDLIQRVPTAEVRIEETLGEGPATVQYGRNRTLLQSMAAAEMPPFPAADVSATDFVLSPGTLARLARQTLFACARDESRPILKGVQLTLGDGKLVAVSTDGTRLSHAWTAIPELRGDPVNMVLAARGLQEAARIAGSEAVAVVVGPKQIRFATAGVALTTLLLEGRFPDYQRVLPEGFVSEVVMPTAAFRGALERVNLIAQREHGAPVRIRHQPGVLEISTQALDVGQAYEVLEVESGGETLELSFNPALLLDAVKSLESEDMVLELAGSQAPARFRERGQSQYFHIVLPLRQLV